MGLWMSSHCRTVVNREGYIKELSKYIDITVVGACSKNDGKECPRGPNSSHKKSCREDLFRNHMFIMSFENAICDEYVTEKIYRALNYPIVPVVMGGANYTKMFPPKSYIDVNDFDSVKDLAVYLKRLSQNLTEYRKYFKWKGQYNKYHYNKWCQLCAKLNEDSMPNLIENAYDLWFKRKNGDYICSNGADRKYNKNSHLKPNKILGSPDIEREIVHIFE